jgi:hypothetical protein
MRSRRCFLLCIHYIAAWCRSQYPSPPKDPVAELTGSVNFCHRSPPPAHWLCYHPPKVRQCGKSLSPCSSPRPLFSLHWLSWKSWPMEETKMIPEDRAESIIWWLIAQSQYRPKTSSTTSSASSGRIATGMWPSPPTQSAESGSKVGLVPVQIDSGRTDSPPLER